MTIVTSVLTSTKLASVGQTVSWHVLRSREVEFFYCPTDAHSFLALQAFVAFTQSFASVLVRVWLLPPAKDNGLVAYGTDTARQEAWQGRDAVCLARLYSDLGLSFPESAVVPCSEEMKLAALCASTAVANPEINGSFLLAPGNLADLIEVGKLVFQGDVHALKSKFPSSTDDEISLKGLARAKWKGVYNSGFIVFGFEWFWGVDRLGYLESLLLQRGLGTRESPIFNRTHPPRLVRPPTSSTPVVLELFWSFRSPYSQIVLKPLVELLKDFPAVKLQVRCVLPMVMRGLDVPLAKKIYIVTDTAREARTIGMPEFGNANDPVGRGVERGFAVLQVINFITGFA
jgi:2-hydroxychromene-2-carboxylate isomerase